MIHTAPHLDGIDPECPRCLSMTLSSLAGPWCEQVTGLTYEELHAFAFSHGPGLGERILHLNALQVLGSRVGNNEPGAEWPHGQRV